MTKLTTLLVSIFALTAVKTINLRKEIDRSFDTSTQNFDIVAAIPGLGLAALFIPNSNLTKSSSGCAVTFKAFDRTIVNGSVLCGSNQTNSDVFYSVLNRHDLSLDSGSVSWNY